MNNPKDMLVSDEQMHGGQAIVVERSDRGMVMNTLRKPMTKAEVRAIYEAELTKLRSERDELVGALDSVIEFVEKDLTYSPHKGSGRFPSYAEGAEISEEVDYVLNPAKVILSKHRPE